jgi:PAS domain S-box-containing protein
MHYRSLVERMSEGVWQFAVDGTILFVNEQLCRLTGYAPRELVGRGLREVFEVEEFAPLFAEELAACARGETSSRRLPLRTRHGEVRWCRLSGAPTRDLDGRLVGRVGVLSDVTEQELAEARADDERRALVESEARFRQLVDHIDAIFWISTADRTRMIYISPAFDRIMGRARKAMYDDPRAVVAWTHPEDRERLGAALDTPPEEDYELEYRILLPDGAVRWLHSRAFTVRDDAGEIHRIAGLTADVTARKAAEEALLESEERLRVFVEHAPAAVAMLDHAMRYVAASRRWREDYGLGGDDLAGRTHDAVFPETPERWKHVYQRCLQGAVEHCDEDPVVRADGRVEWVRWEVRPWRREDGAIGGIIMFSERVTEKKQAKEQLLRSEARYRYLVEHLPDAITELDPEGRVLFTTRDVPGFSREQMIGAPVLDFIPPADRGVFEAALMRAVARREPQDFSARADAQGGEAWWNHRVIPVVEDGVVTRLLVIATDVTARKRAEDALRESEHRYRRFFDEDLSGDFIARPDGTLVACNPAFARTLGFASVDEALAANLRDLFPSREAARRVTKALSRRGKLEHLEAEMRRHDGAPVHVVANVVGTFDDDGRLLEIQGFLFDDSARKNLEGELRQAQKLEAIGRLTGGVAHDFNNILTSIAGYNEMLLQRTEPGTPVQRYAREIGRAAERAGDLTRRLLEFGRKRDIELRLVDLNAVVRDMEAMLRRTIGESVELVVALDDSLGRIQSDPGVIENALLNLALNARDAMPDGGTLTIESRRADLDGAAAAAVPGAEPGAYAALTVRDTGVGMDGETQSRAFEPFFTTKEPGRGVGLGLATVRGALRQCGGHIRVISEPGRGAAFHMYFEMVDAPAQAAVPGERQVVLGPADGTETVLVAEDEPAVRKLLREVLEARGYRVLYAGDGQEALRVADGHPGRIDLLVTDLVMPHMNGRELALRLGESHAGLKVLYISGYIGKSAVRIAELGPGASFLSKPFSPQSLARKVRLLLDADKVQPPRSLAQIASRVARRAPVTPPKPSV